MRARYIVARLLDKGIKPDLFIDLPEKGRDYTALGLPSQGFAINLAREGVFRDMGDDIFTNPAGKKVRRTLWGRGCHYEAFMDYWIKYKKQLSGTVAALSEYSQPVAV